jgi:hypothetical protein
MKQLVGLALLPVITWAATIEFNDVKSVKGGQKEDQICQQAFSGTWHADRVANEQVKITHNGRADGTLVNLVRGRKHRVIYNYGQMNLNDQGQLHFSGVGLDDERIVGVFYTGRCQGGYTYLIPKA